MVSVRNLEYRLRNYFKKLLSSNSKYRDQMSNTTRFFRNYPQLLAVAGTIADTWQAGSNLDVIHIGGSTGCEAISFMIVMKESQPSYKLNVLSTDVDAHTLRFARRLRYDPEFFTPILGEGGNQDALRDKWFRVDEISGRPVYIPDDTLTKDLKFQVLDVSETDHRINADIIFCQNVLIHMLPATARASLENVLGMLRSPSILVCAGMDLNLKNLIADAGLLPVPELIQEIHDAWASHRFHYRNSPGKHYFELEDIDVERQDWVLRYSSIFVKR
jgi:chemotaxis methyl-accepting protein methylase